MQSGSVVRKKLSRGAKNLAPFGVDSVGFRRWGDCPQVPLEDRADRIAGFATGAGVGGQGDASRLFSEVRVLNCGRGKRRFGASNNPKEMWLHAAFEMD